MDLTTERTEVSLYSRSDQTYVQISIARPQGPVDREALRKSYGYGSTGWNKPDSPSGKQVGEESFAYSTDTYYRVKGLTKEFGVDVTLTFGPKHVASSKSETAALTERIARAALSDVLWAEAVRSGSASGYVSVDDVNPGLKGGRWDRFGNFVADLPKGRISLPGGSARAFIAGSSVELTKPVIQVGERCFIAKDDAPRISSQK